MTEIEQIEERLKTFGPGTPGAVIEANQKRLAELKAESKPDSPGPSAQFGESSPDSKHWIHPELTAYFRQKPPPWPWQLWNDKTGEWIVFDCIEDIEAATEIVFDAAQVSQPGLFEAAPEVGNGGYYSQ